MKKKILICDDEEDILELCSHILRKEYEVGVAQNVTDIVELVEEHTPHLILLDLWMPQIGGEESVKLLKANKKTKHIPVLLFSAHDDIENIVAQTGANGFLQKPFNSAELIAAIHLYLKDE
jgi:DNA-binding NtrC family response regulator